MTSSHEPAPLNIHSRTTIHFVPRSGFPSDTPETYQMIDGLLRWSLMGQPKRPLMRVAHPDDVVVFKWQKEVNVPAYVTETLIELAGGESELIDFIEKSDLLSEIINDGWSFQYIRREGYLYLYALRALPGV